MALQEQKENIVNQNSVQHPVKVRYKNFRGEIAIRTIIPMRYEYKSTEYHKEEQYILVVWDVERNAEREYAAQDILEWFVKE